jgi:hypothetical protein
MAPIKAYLELLAQPAIIIPYTEREEIAKRYKIPTFILEITHPSATGITAQAAIERENATIGAIIKTNLLETDGKIDSLENSLIPSAKGCNRPQIPTTFGPFLSCAAAITFLSA